MAGNRKQGTENWILHRIFPRKEPKPYVVKRNTSRVIDNRLPRLDDFVKIIRTSVCKSIQERKGSRKNGTRASEDMRRVQRRVARGLESPNCIFSEEDSNKMKSVW